MNWSVLIIGLILAIPITDSYAQTSQADQWCIFLAQFGLCEIKEIHEPKYYAKIENSTVTNIIVATFDFIITQPGVWVPIDESKTQEYNRPIIGHIYWGDDLFIPPQPSDDAILNLTSYQWFIPQQELPPVVNGT